MKRVWLAVACLCLGTLSSAHAQAPTIKSFKPTSGPVGTRVNIAGENLINTTGVTFGGGVAATDGAFGETGVSVYVPPGAQTGPITVLGSSGNVTTSQDFVVTDAATPTPTPTPVPDAPVITSPTTVKATQGQPFIYLIKTDRPVSTYTAVNVPGGLNFDGGTGFISGTPSESGTYTMQVGAIDAEGNHGTADVTIEIVASDEPAMTVSVAPARIASGGGQPAVFTFHLSHPVDHVESINYVVRGTLAGGFALSPSYQGEYVGSVVVPAGASRVKMKIKAEKTLALGAVGVQTFEIKLQQYPDGPLVGTPAAAKLKVVFP